MVARRSPAITTPPSNVAATIVVPCGTSIGIGVSGVRRRGSRSGECAPRKSANEEIPGVMKATGSRASVIAVIVRPSGRTRVRTPRRCPPAPRRSRRGWRPRRRRASPCARRPAGRLRRRGSSSSLALRVVLCCCPPLARHRLHLRLGSRGDPHRARPATNLHSDVSAANSASAVGERSSRAPTCSLVPHAAAPASGSAATSHDRGGRRSPSPRTRPRSGPGTSPGSGRGSTPGCPRRVVRRRPRTSVVVDQALHRTRARRSRW